MTFRSSMFQLTTKGTSYECRRTETDFGSPCRNGGRCQAGFHRLHSSVSCCPHDAAPYSTRRGHRGLRCHWKDRSRDSYQPVCLFHSSRRGQCFAAFRRMETGGFGASVHATQGVSVTITEVIPDVRTSGWAARADATRRRLPHEAADFENSVTVLFPMEV